MQIVIFVVLVVLAIAALFVAAARSATQISVEARLVMGQDGREREQRSFSAWHENTLIGLTIGRAYIAIASSRFDRQETARANR